MQTVSESPRASRLKPIMSSILYFGFRNSDCGIVNLKSPICNLKSLQNIFETFVSFNGADVVPFAFVYDDSPDRSRVFHDSSDKDGNDGFDFVGLKKLNERFLHRIDTGKEAVLNSWVSQGVPEIADLTALIDVYIQKRAPASQGKGYLRSLLLMGFQKLLQGKIGHHIAIVAEDGFVIVQEIFNVFESTRRV